MASLNLRTRYGADYNFFMAKGHGGFIPVPTILTPYLKFLIIDDQETRRNPETKEMEIIRAWQRPIMLQEILMLKLMIEARYSLSETIPPAAHIAAEMHLSDRQARHWRANLVRSGLLEIEPQPGKPSLVSIAPLIAKIRQICGYVEQEAAQDTASKPEIVAEVPADTWADAEQDSISQVLADLSVRFGEALHAPENARQRMLDAQRRAKWGTDLLFFEMYQAAGEANKKEAARRWAVFFREMDTRVKQAQIKAAEEREWNRYLELQDEQQRAMWDEQDYDKAERIGVELQEWQARHTLPLAVGAD